MTRTKKRVVDELRPEYKRSDFGILVRGKYLERLQESEVVAQNQESRTYPLPEGQDGE